MDLEVFTTEFKPGTKILITGHTGFKGTWLTLLLERLGFEVCGMSLEAETGSLYERLNRKNKIEEKIFDIRDFNAVTQSISALKPNLIFHLAAQPLVLASYIKPRETFETNIMGTVNILESALKTSSVSHVSVITTDKVYKNDEIGRKFTEVDPLAGKDPYSASKVGTEAAVLAWIQLSKSIDGPRVTSVRAGNVIGGGDYAEFRLLPDLVRGFKNKQSVKIRNPHSTRPWQHVLDPLAGYLLAVAKNNSESSEPAFNFAPIGESLSVKTVCEIAAEAWGNGAKIEFDQDETKLEAKSLELDSTLAQNLLDWNPTWTQREAVVSTIEWWKKTSQDPSLASEACQTDLDKLLSS
jgi:CDP-glucose 4,6-dehydratase